MTDTITDKRDFKKMVASLATIRGSNSALWVLGQIEVNLRPEHIDVRNAEWKCGIVYEMIKGLLDGLDQHDEEQS